MPNKATINKVVVSFFILSFLGRYTGCAPSTLLSRKIELGTCNRRGHDANGFVAGTRGPLKCAVILMPEKRRVKRCDPALSASGRGQRVAASSPPRPLRPPRFFLPSGSESTAEDAEDAEEKRECERATHYHPTTQKRVRIRNQSAMSYSKGRYEWSAPTEHTSRDRGGCHFEEGSSLRQTEMTIISLEDIAMSYGPRQLFEGVTYGLEDSDKVGLIGLNGSGKSTLLRIIAGQEQPQRGRSIIANERVVAYLPQNPEFDPDQTVLDAVFTASDEAMQLLRDYELACHDLSLNPGDERTLNRVATLAHQLEASGGWNLETN